MVSYDSKLIDETKKCLYQQQSLEDNATSRTCVSRPRVSSNRHYILLSVLLLLLSQCYTVTGFNLDVNFSTIATIPNKNSYFGFSVGLYAGEQESWLLVGAPKFRRHGEIFKCKYEKDVTTANCTIIPIDRETPQAPNVDAMFGQTLLPGPSGKQLLACSPRHTDKSEKKSQSLGTVLYYDLVGVCYFVRDFTNTAEYVYTLNPCIDDKGAHHDGDKYGQCEIGFSAAFTKDGNSLVLGAPRALYQGSLMRIDLPITSDVTKLPLHTGDVKPTIPPGWEETEYLMQSYDENYLGYASATVRTIANKTVLVAGAPARFRYDLYGMVIVFDIEFSETLLKFTGNQTGEYFGSAIASADLNNDGLDDLIIGAPQYSAKDRKIYESGRIFIYYQTGGKIHDNKGYLQYVNFSEPTIIEGTKAKARFGYAISAIGDINQDGYEDIAVGAPYTVNEEGSDHPDGSVFIFNGGPEGLVTPASQEIKGNGLGERLTAFGGSIYGGKDMDGNLYPDIVVGAYLSSHAIMIRSRPVVMIESSVTTDPDVVDLDKPSCRAKGRNGANCFKITACFAYTGKSVPESLQLSYTYDIDSGKTGDDKRAFIFDEEPRNITLTRKNIKKSETACVEEYAYLKYNIKDKLSDIKIKVSHSLIEKIAPLQPIVDELQPPYSTASVKISRDCGDDDICQADLKLNSELSTTQVYAGKSWPFILEQRVQNKGEPAYQATLVVEYPAYVHYVGTQREGSTTGIPQLCTNNDNFVTCEMGNPMKHDADVKVNLKFQTYKLNGKFTELAISSFVNSTNPTNNTSEVTSSALQIGVKSEITIDTTSRPPGFYLKKEEAAKLEANTTIVTHTYQVINKGPSDVAKASIRLMWPLKTNDGRILLEMQQIEENHNFVSCSSDRMLANAQTKNATDGSNYYYCDGRALCAAVDCSVDGVFEQLQIRAIFRLPFSTLVQNDLDSFMRSEFQFTIDEYPYAISQGGGPTFNAEVTTEFVYQREPVSNQVPWWIIIVAVAAGLLCLLILILVLWKCGFFKRLRPESDEDQAQKQALNPNSDEKADEDEMEEYLK